MNEPSLNDPQLQSLEARLAAMAPQEAAARQNELLYRCAFAVGQNTARKTVRRWQAAVAGLTLLLVAVSIPLARNKSLVVNHKPALVPPRQMDEPQPPMLVQQEAPPTAREPVHVNLDAWRVPPSPGTSLASELAHFQQVDPGLRSLAAGPLARAVLRP